MRIIMYSVLAREFFCHLIIITNFFNFRWQARKEGDRNMRAGLIPSRALQEHRTLLQRMKKEKTEDDSISKKEISISIDFSVNVCSQFVLLIFDLVECLRDYYAFAINVQCSMFYTVYTTILKNSSFKLTVASLTFTLYVFFKLLQAWPTTNPHF